MFHDFIGWTQDKISEKNIKTSFLMTHFDRLIFEQKTAFILPYPFANFCLILVRVCLSIPR